MRFMKSIIAGLLLSSFSVQAQTEKFLKAQATYDGGRYAEAVLLYEGLLNDGVDNAEVHYNLGNAYFKDSDLPKAILHYRNAGYNLPRDPDIKANLHFALNAAGAIEPVPSFMTRLLSALSYNEWIMLATGGYLLLSIILLMLLIIKTGRRAILKLLLLPGAMLLISYLGWNHWKQLKQNPEWVVVKTEATTLFGPVEGSTAHFKLPLGALVKQRNIDSKGWVQVEYDGKQGWLRTEFITPVSP
jgi:tetratricopeptide (TPR) repeat protein